MKTDKNFRLSKRSKTIVALICKSNQDRNHLRGMLVQSQAAAEAAQRQALRGKGSKNKDSE